MDRGKENGSPTIQGRTKSWGLPGLWISPLPKLPECEDENAEIMSAPLPSDKSDVFDSITEPIYFLSVKQGTSGSEPVIVMDQKKETKEAPELSTPSSEITGNIPHGDLEGGMRRNAQSFDENMLGFVSEMPIPEDYMKQNRGFVSSLYGSFSELNIGKKTMSSQPSSAESSRCSSPTGFITDKVKESGITASPGKVQGRFGRLFRDLNATSPSQW